jgi:pimeloyl-ACP methyl ester carboxylesterase
VRDAAWWWSQMAAPLADRGIASVTVALPSCGETDDELGDLYADVNACRRAIAAADGRVILCGHSYAIHPAATNNGAGHDRRSRLVDAAAQRGNRRRCSWPS